MNDTLGIAHFIAHLDLVGQAVLAFLLLASVLSWALILLKVFHLARLRHESRDGGAWLAALDQPQNLQERAQTLEKRHAHAALVGHALRAQALIQQRQRQHGAVSDQTEQQLVSSAFRRALIPLKQQLDRGQTVLATIASSAPFVGLLGTVWGIYHALIAIGRSGQSSLDKVAGPVGEALIMTGLGLAVAIPAAVAYNLLGQAARNRLAHLHEFAAQVFEDLTAWPDAHPASDSPGGGATRTKATGPAATFPRAAGARA